MFISHSNPAEAVELNTLRMQLAKLTAQQDYLAMMSDIELLDEETEIEDEEALEDGNE